MLSKISADNVFIMHYFQNMSLSSRVLPFDPTRAQPLTPLGDFSPISPNLPTPGKILRASKITDATSGQYHRRILMPMSAWINTAHKRETSNALKRSADHYL